ncbi:MAG: glycosyltransferase family 2 protein [Planctomycetota bacterium]|nr:glycosyltransferase family 2 protein [Planctomycetota bacterium]
MPTLFTVVPCFNEAATLAEVVDAIIAAPLPKGWARHVILVDDASDAIGVREARNLAVRHSAAPLTLIEHPMNQGKGAALRSGFAHALAVATDPKSAVMVHDADLEYDPTDHALLIDRLESAHSDAVYGNRWHCDYHTTTWKRKLHRLGNRFLTRFSNALTGYHVMDMECCLKLLSIGILARVMPQLSENRFGIEPQLTAALARSRAQIEEVNVRYCARGFSQGKKIGSCDAFRAVVVMLRERFFHNHRSSGQ